jgi:hypothetical protein
LTQINPGAECFSARRDQIRNDGAAGVASDVALRRRPGRIGQRLGSCREFPHSGRRIFIFTAPCRI